jgi:hypothetical protein
MNIGRLIDAAAVIAAIGLSQAMIESIHDGHITGAAGCNKDCQECDRDQPLATFAACRLKDK